MANIAGGFVVVAHTMLAIELGMSMMTSPWAGGPGGTAGAGRVGAAGLEAVGLAVRLADGWVVKEVWKKQNNIWNPYLDMKRPIFLPWQIYLPKITVPFVKFVKHNKSSNFGAFGTRDCQIDSLGLERTAPTQGDQIRLWKNSPKM
jgi:hypothetical protein